MPKHTLIKLLLASMGFTCSMLAREKTKDKDLAPEINVAKLPEEKFFSLNVPDNAKISHLHVTHTTHLDGHLDVDDNVSIENHLYVGGDQENNKHLNVGGNQHNNAKITVDKNASFKERIIVKDNGIFKNNLFVDQDTVLKGNEIINENLRIKLDLEVDDNATINKNVLVEGFIHAESNLNVDENMYVKGYECIGKNLTVKGYQLLEQTGTVNKNAIVTGDSSIDGNQSIGGNIILKGDLGLAGDLQISGTATLKKNLNVNENENISGNLFIAGHSCIDGNICVDKTLKAPTLITDTLTTNTATIQNANISGTLFTNEIDPLSEECFTTLFSGNVMIDRPNKLIVHEISPALEPVLDSKDCNCPEKQPDCNQVPNESGVTLIASNIGLHNKGLLLVNEINPVTKDACNKVIANDDGITCFGGNVAVSSEKQNRLLINYIDPITKNNCGQCVQDDGSSAVTCFSGNVAVNRENLSDYYYCPSRLALLVNTINPVMIDSITHECRPDNSLDAITCFSGNVALDTTNSHTLHVNYIDPVTTDTLTGKCIPDTSPCAATNFSGNISIKNGHYFGQLNYACQDYYYQNYSDHFNLCLRSDSADPVLRLTFNNIDPDQLPFPQGAWVKLTILGKISINDFSTDVFSELYFFVGPGFQASCSSFAGSINGLFSVFNTLSGHACIAELDPNITNPSLQLDFASPSKFFGHTLFEQIPDPDKTQTPIFMLGTTVSSSLLPQAVDVLLIPMLPFGGVTIMDNITIFYEIISPNLDPNNPPCVPAPRLDDTNVFPSTDPAIYSNAIQTLFTTYGRAADFN